jgi:hypothetical protein
MPAWDRAEPPAVRGYVALQAAASPDIDGRLEDSAWSPAPWSESFVDIEGSSGDAAAPRWETRVKLIWDAQFLYLGAELVEPHVWGTLTQRDTVIYYDNDFELFVDPDGDTHRYFELEINALGTVWDLFLARPYRDGGPADNGWDIDGLRSAVWVDGTLNRADDHDRGWYVELAIPWASFSDDGRTPVPPRDGDQWRVNFSRVQWETEVVDGAYRKKTTLEGRPLPEHNWVWSPQYAVNMHLPEMWGVVQFSSRTSVGGEVSFTTSPPMDASVRWLLRRGYYAQRDYHRTHGRYADTLEELSLALDPVLAPTLTLTQVPDGYDLRSTIGESEWHITDDGRIWKQ